MAKLRINHSRGGSNSSVSMVKISIFLGVLLLMLYYLYQYTIGTKSPLLQNANKQQNQNIGKNTPVGDVKVIDNDNNSFYPCGDGGELVEHKHYSLSYNESAEQANWVAYKLTKSSILVPNVKRGKWFDPDYSVKTGSAFHRDYKGSGYSRGHLAPAGDMAFSKEAMKESFLMSNMSPQLRAFNGGIWNELEQHVRDWAFDNNEVYVVTGPMLNRKIVKRIGKNKVKVPSAFYKIVLDNYGEERKAIAFIMPNEMSTLPLRDYIVTIDDIERELGIDFFCNLLSENEQKKLESISDIGKWRVNKKKYDLRVGKWNFQ